MNSRKTAQGSSLFGWKAELHTDELLTGRGPSRGHLTGGMRGAFPNLYNCTRYSKHKWKAARKPGTLRSEVF